MFGRIFGRGKDESEQAVCAKCGRTLLAGEWTRKVTGPDGEERLLCSLCGPDLPLDQDEPPESTWTPANNGRVRESRQEVAAKPDGDEPAERVMDKDAVIGSLQERLARAEAQNQELRRELAEVRAAVEPDAAGRAASPTGDSTGDASSVGPTATMGLEMPVDSSEPGERTWGETPAEFAAELAAARMAAAGGEEALSDVSAADVPSAAFEDTQPLPVVEALEAEIEEETPVGVPETVARASVAAAAEPLLEEPQAPARGEEPAIEESGAEEPAVDESAPDQPAAEEPVAGEPVADDEVPEEPEQT
jgi:hypothetical protein